MSSNPYENMGQILARLPFEVSDINIYGPVITEQKQSALENALGSSVYELIRACRDDDDNDLPYSVCISGFVQELVRILVASRHDQKPPEQKMHVDGHDWELVFDPGPKSRNLLTDDKGRVWRRIGQDNNDYDPF